MVRLQNISSISSKRDSSGFSPSSWLVLIVLLSLLVAANVFWESVAALALIMGGIFSIVFVWAFVAGLINMNGDLLLAGYIGGTIAAILLISLYWFTLVPLIFDLLEQIGHAIAALF